MNNRTIVKPYFDLKDQASNESGFFFLQHILKARADLHLETGLNEFDQEVNVYLSGLLNSMVDARDLIRTREYISIFDVDVRRYLDEHPGTRNEYIVYRENADFGLVQESFFQGDPHPGSYYHIVMPEETRQDRIVLYYELAASALSHLQGNRVALVPVFMAMAEYMPQIVQIVRRAATCYFDMIERLSDGSLYHLQREMNEKGIMSMYQEKLDAFLALYLDYKKNPSEENQKQLLVLARELNAMNEKFRFEAEIE
ncbi:MAG: hypothetical protein JW768_13730 [Chitinispirillaceae bacterium]|nr:hypothetical protein [Chitinispirillaceae bacterium]